ncbi:MAG: NAD(P)-binding domain-containing protein [Verrucomicrobia bacterium]|nr:NAD(P)-binding domain-containing protein [Verrucomicrobiota bacterium]
MSVANQSGDSIRPAPARRLVAIIGSGPGGLVVAKFLKQHGWEPVLFEQNDALGGQWNARSPHSGVWPSMVTNTSRWLTCFSDLAPEPKGAIFPSNGEILSYLGRYAQTFDLLRHIRYATRVETIERDPRGGGWVIGSNSGAEARSETFPYVVVASGRFTTPLIPPLPGLESFCGRGGALHSLHYKRPEGFRGQRVLVVGCAISALEIASDLAMLGAARVVSTYRRQRYVVPKLVAGVPSDTLAFTRFAALSAEVTPREALAKATQDHILRAFGSPERFGARPPDGDFLTVGRGLSQHFLPLVAEGRIVVKPWLRLIEGPRVRFSDESAEEFDAIILGTGFELSLPFLSAAIRRTLRLNDAQDAELYHFTFHPDLPGLAFVGLWEQTGPYFPPLELQARWIAYAWSGLRPLPPPSQMEAALAAQPPKRGGSQPQAMHLIALRFAREAGVEPELSQWPLLARALLFGPLSAASFRLAGPDRLPEAAERIQAEARALGTVVSPEFSREQVAQLQALAAARKEAGFTGLVDRITKPSANAQGPEE